MAARAATSAVKGRLPTLRRVCSLFSRPTIAAQSTDFPFRRRIIKPLAQLISKRGTETEVEKALRTGDAFVKHRVIENLQVSTIKEVDQSHNDKPIFFVSRLTTSGDHCCTALSLEDDGNVSPKYDIYSPFSNYACFSICYGVFCFTHGVKRNILLWNPTTNESKILPQCQSCAEVSPGVTKGTLTSVSGIWVDDKSQDCKVVRFISWYYDEWEAGPYDSHHEIELYSLKTDSWKKISCPGFSFCLPSTARINGVYYMRATHSEVKSNDVILTFDFSTETVSYLPLPDIGLFIPFYILDYNGLLSILSYRSVKTEKLYEPWGVSNEKFYEHWVMRSGTWCRLSVFHTCNVGRPLGFSRNGELLFFESLDSHQLLVFDSATGKLKHLDDFGSYIFELIPFSESFVKLNGGSELEAVPAEIEKREIGDQDSLNRR